MLTVATDRHRLHHPRERIHDGGRLVPPPEIPERAERILAALADARLGDIVEPAPFGRDPIGRVHTDSYLEFLEHAHRRWRTATGEEHADSFRLTGDDFLRIGSATATIDRPTVFVQEGGYCLDVIGRNVVNVLRAFLDT